MFVNYFAVSEDKNINESVVVSEEVKSGTDKNKDKDTGTDPRIFISPKEYLLFGIGGFIGVMCVCWFIEGSYNSAVGIIATALANYFKSTPK